MKLRKALSAMDFSLTENRSSWRFVPDTRTFNVSVRRVEGERMPGMLSWPTLKGDIAGRIIPRPAPEIGERGERIVVGDGVENPMMERMISKRWPAAGMVGVRLTGKYGGNVKCKRFGETGHKSVRCPDQICGVCGGKGHSGEVCANVVTVLACENTKSPNDESDAAISGEEEEAFVCDMSGEYNDESIDERGCSALA